MKLVLLVSALLSLAVAAPPGFVRLPFRTPGSGKDCVCSIPRCPGTQPELCNCLQAAAFKCYSRGLEEGKKCPKPTSTDCALATVTQTPEPTPTCACQTKLCPQIWPESCHCENSLAQECYSTCGGPTPSSKPCTGGLPPATTPAPPPTLTQVVPIPVITPKCECETLMCIQSWPESCKCENNNKRKCFEQCGGVEPDYKDCGAPVRRDEPSAYKSMEIKPSPTPYQRCGGFRNPAIEPCPETHVCVDNPFEPGCGMACDMPGICVENRMCGGFLGLPCPKGMKCMDDPRDDCNTKKGGADCAGLCFWKPR